MLTRQMEFSDLLSEIEGDVCIYGFGIVGKWLTHLFKGEGVSITDTDTKKYGQSYNNMRCDPLVEIIEKQPKHLIIAVVDIHEVLPLIKFHFPTAKIHVLADYLTNHEKFMGEVDGRSTSFLDYSLKAVKTCQRAILDEDKSFLRSLDIVVSERCSLKCKDCSNLMQYYESPINYTSKEIIDWMNQLFETIGHIFEVRIIGGEPFMNKDVYNVIDYFLDIDKVSKVVVYTNATILLKESLISKHAGNDKLVFFLTDYGDLAHNTKKFLGQLEIMGLTYRAVPPTNWTDSARINQNKREASANQLIFDKCCGKNLYTLMDGRLYRCPFTANADALMAIPSEEGNSVGTSASLEDITAFIYGKKFTPACDFCNGRSYDAAEIEPAIQVKTSVPYKKYVPISAL